MRTMKKHGIFISYHWIILALIGLGITFWSVSTITAQPPIPHAVPADIESDCLSCHQAGVAGAPRLAWDHLGRTNEDCSQCHVISGNFSRSIPHTLEGRDACYDCHLDGSGGSPQVAGNHASYEVDTCETCHPHEMIIEEVAEVEEEGPEVYWGLDTGKTCLNCHRQQNVKEEHVEIAMIAQTKELKKSLGEFLFVAHCATCHGDDGKTEGFPPEAEDEEKSKPKKDDTEVEVEIRIILNSEEYLSTHDDASIMQAVIALPGNPDHVYARAYGGRLKFDDVVNLGAYIRAWGEMGSELDYPVPSFSEDVYPIIEAECGGQCHLEKQKGGFSVENYEAIMTSGEHASENIIPGDPNHSLLAQKLQNRQKTGDMMPTDRQLRSSDISLIIEWIRAGALDN